MRVCLVAPLHASKLRGYGVERYAFEIQEGLKKRGVKFRTISSSALLGRKESSRAVRAMGIAYEGLQLVRSVRKNEVVHFTEPVLTLTSLAIPRVPHVVTTVHEVPDVVSHGPGLGAGMAIMRFAISNSELVIADSTFTKNDLVVKMGVQPEKIAVVNLGVDDRFQPGPRARTQSGKVIGYIGAVSKRKNVDVLLEAFGILKSRHPGLDVALELWGPKSSSASELALKAKSQGLKGIHLHGFADEGSLPSVYRSFDVFAFPSLKEGFGLPILEAKRCGIPTVLLREARIAEEVKAGSLLAEDASDMAEKIHGLLSDPARSNSVSESGREYARRFTWEKTVSETVQIYERVMSSRSVSSRAR